MRTLDPSLPANAQLTAPNAPGVASRLTSPSLSPRFVPRLKSESKDLKQQSDEESVQQARGRGTKSSPTPGGQLREELLLSG